MAQAAVSPPPATGAAVELDDIQGLVRFAYKHHTEAVFLLLLVKDAGAARVWLAQVAVTSAITQDPVPGTALPVGWTSNRLCPLGVADDVIKAFSSQFGAGIAGSSPHSRHSGAQ